MPNIELHGFSRGQAMEIRDKVFKLFKGKPYVKEMVVTVCLDMVWDKYGDIQPFIRLANSCQDHTVEILKVLEALNVDIEQLTLAKFIPKKKT